MWLGQVILGGTCVLQTIWVLSKFPEKGQNKEYVIIQLWLLCCSSETVPISCVSLEQFFLYIGSASVPTRLVFLPVYHLAKGE